MNTILLWFKNDLRLHDNEALQKAIDRGKNIIPVYIFDTERYRNLELGFPKTDQVGFDFIRQSVENLRENLKSISGNLLIRTGNTAEILPELTRQFNCDAIYAEQEFATEECQLIAKIKNSLAKTCEIHLFWGRTLYHLDDIPYRIDKIPLTSKAYRINTTKNAAIRKTIPTPEYIQIDKSKNIVWGQLSTPQDVGFASEKNFEKTFVSGGETEALKRLNTYLFETEQLTSYRWTRNRSLGMDYSSKFSPYMALGCLSPRTIYEAVKLYEKDIKKNQSTWWMIFEVVWRDYFTFKLMRMQNAVYQTEGYSKKELEFENDTNLFKRWCTGTTGIPFVDAHMRQLNQTGFMSNRGRVNCASFLVHDYKIDWTWGASYFESKLIDYDVASNWINWHVQAYEIWYTNPVNQANKYKAQEFIRKWIPEIENLNDLEVLIPWEFEGHTYQKPVELFNKWNRAINKIKKEN